jgi:hypothetical protein
MNPPTVKTIADPGDSEWLFRLLQQISQLSQGALLSENERADFDSARMRLIEVLRQCNDARKQLIELFTEHVEHVAEGRGVFVNESGALIIEDDIVPRLNRAVNGFFVPARTALYHLFGQKPVAGKKPAKSILEILTGFNFGFVFIFNSVRFEQAAQNYLSQIPGVRSKALIDVIRSDRDTWSLGLQEIRDTIIHDTEYDGLKMVYQANGIKIAIGFPRLNGKPMLDFVEMFWNNLIESIEEVILLTLCTRMPPLVALDRIPQNEWDPTLPFRWRGILLDHPTP